MKGKLHKGTVLLGLCSLSFYCGAQITGQTEAAFSSQAQIKPVKLSAAVVFPDTVENLNEKANIIYSRKSHYIRPYRTLLMMQVYKS